MLLHDLLLSPSWPPMLATGSFVLMCQGMTKNLRVTTCLY